LTLIIESTECRNRHYTETRTWHATTYTFFFLFFFCRLKSCQKWCRIPYNFQIYSYLFHGHTLVFLAKWFGNVLITWARVYFIMPPNQLLLFMVGPGVQFDVSFGTVIVGLGHDNGFMFVSGISS